MPRGNVRVSITADASGVARETKAAERHLDRFGKGASKSFKTVGGAAGMLDSRLGKLAKAASAVGVAYLAIAEGKEAVSVTTDLAKATIGLNKNLGISVKTASEWAAVAKVRGIETKQLNQSFGILGKNLQGATEQYDKQRAAISHLGKSEADRLKLTEMVNQGAGKQANAFRSLGITQAELVKHGGNFNDILKMSADGLNRLEPGARRNTIAMTLFGRGWQSIVPILRDGSKGMQEQLNLARKYGATFSGGTIKSMKDFIAAQREARFATLGLQVAFGTKLAPALAKVLPAVAQFVNGMRTGKGAGGDFAHTMGDVVKGLVAFGKWTLNAIHNVNAWGDNTRHVIFAIGRWFSDTFNDIKRIFGNVMASIYRGFAKLFDVASHLPGIGGKFGDLRDRANAYADEVDRAGERTKRLRDQIAALPSKKQIDLQVNLALADLASGKVKPLVADPNKGDGWGIEAAAKKLVQRKVDSGQIDPFGFPLGGGLGSANLMGANANLGPFAAIGSRMGLHVSSGLRPGSITDSGNVSYHASGRAIDMADGAKAMLAYAQVMASNFGGRLKELIHTPLGFSIKNGQRVAPYSTAAHYNHVHVAMQRGGMLPGSRTGDRNLAALEDGEFVVNSKATSRALPLLEALNRGIPRFQKGGKVGTFDATSYGPPWGGIQGTGTTATGVDLHGSPHLHGIAVDPSVLSLGKNYYVWPNPFGYSGAFKAFDTGGAIKGNRIDFYDWRGRSAQLGWGHKSVTVSTAAIRDKDVKDKNPNIPGVQRLTPAERKARTPVHGRRTSREGIEARQDVRHESRWDAVQGIRDDDVVTRKERRQADRAYLARAKVLNQRIAQKKARLRKIARALKGKLTPGTRTRLLREQATLISDIGGDMSALKGLTQEFQDLVAPFESEPDSPFAGVDMRSALASLTADPADDIAAAQERVGIAAGGLAVAQQYGDVGAITQWANDLKSAKDALDGLTGAVNEQTEATKAHTAAVEAAREDNKRLEYLLNTQSPQILDQMRALISTSMMRTVTLGRQAAGSPGRAASL